MMRKQFPWEKSNRSALNRSKDKNKDVELGVGGLMVSRMFKKFGDHSTIEVQLTDSGKVAQIMGGDDKEKQPEDNIRAAVDRVMDAEKLTRKTNTGSKPGATANKQVLIRATEEDHESWKKAASEMGVSLSEFVREACNKHAKSTQCDHPVEFRRVYPWSEFCDKCGKRLRG